MSRTSFLFILFLQMTVACRKPSGPEQVAGHFLSAYLDCRFSDAERLAESNVADMMRWRASQLTQAEVELVSENNPQVQTLNVEDMGDSCVVWLMATDALIMDSIGQPGCVGSVRYRVSLHRRSGQDWKVMDVGVGF
ncbi:MAG: hypothetical protein IJ064_00555 [Bacteroidaceae bacterium]|nr:hypothetical protein [Bacteroidaceae bacterium]